MPIILRNTLIGRRAHFIDEDDLASMLEAGTAIQCEGYDIFEEVTDAEISQGYMTRNMAALPVPGKKRGRPPKVKEEIPMAEENEVVEEVTEEAAAEEVTEEVAAEPTEE